VVYARKVDSTQAEIVSGLRAAGYRVELIGEPVDLAVMVWSNNPRRWLWQFLEVKRKSGLRRKDQPSQNKFLDETNTPIVATLEEALEALK
jgi:hypothetical protein